MPVRILGFKYRNLSQVLAEFMITCLSVIGRLFYGKLSIGAFDTLRNQYLQISFSSHPFVILHVKCFCFFYRTENQDLINFFWGYFELQ